MATTISDLVNYTPIDELIMIYKYRLNEDIRRYEVLHTEPFEMAINTSMRQLIRCIFIYKMSGRAINDYVDIYGNLGQHEYHENQYPFPRHKISLIKRKAKLFGLQDYFEIAKDRTFHEIEQLEDYKDNIENDEDFMEYVKEDILREELDKLYLKKAKNELDLIKIRQIKEELK